MSRNALHMWHMLPNMQGTIEGVSAVTTEHERIDAAWSARADALGLDIDTDVPRIAGVDPRTVRKYRTADVKRDRIVVRKIESALKVARGYTEAVAEGKEPPTDEPTAKESSDDVRAEWMRIGAEATTDQMRALINVWRSLTSDPPTSYKF